MQQPVSDSLDGCAGLLPCGIRPAASSSLVKPGSERTNALDLVKLTALMNVTQGSPEVRVGLIDGPVWRTQKKVLSAEF